MSNPNPCGRHSVASMGERPAAHRGFKPHTPAVAAIALINNCLGYMTGTQNRAHRDISVEIILPKDNKEI